MKTHGNAAHKGYIFNIKRFALHDGPGIRTTVFFKGCPLDCWWCHNPESLKPGGSDGIGKEMTPLQLLEEIEKEVIFYDESGGGVTLSGGEPLMQLPFLEETAKGCRQKDIHVALDTTGCLPPRRFEALTGRFDLFLFDLKLMDDAGHLKYTGTSNRDLLENLSILDREQRPTVIRFPLVPTVTDTEENLAALAGFVSSLKTIRDIDILPYHRAAEAKYLRLNLEYRVRDLHSPSQEVIKRVREFFSSYGLRVTVQ